MKQSTYRPALIRGFFYGDASLQKIMARPVVLPAIPDRVVFARKDIRWHITDAASGIKISSLADEQDTLKETLKLTNERVQKFLDGGGSFEGLVHKRLTEHGYIPMTSNVKRFKVA